MNQSIRVFLAREKVKGLETGGILYRLEFHYTLTDSFLLIGSSDVPECVPRISLLLHVIF
jgi:hypothetical protein